MKKKFIFAIFIVAVLSIGLMHINPITAINDGNDIQLGSNGLGNDYKVVHDDNDSIYNDYDYVDMNYSTNTDNNPLNRLFYGDTVDIYFDAQGTMVSNNFDSNISYKLSHEIADFVSENMNNSTMDLDEMKEGVQDICKKYGSDHTTVNVDSFIGKDQIPIIVWAQGASMLPTIQDGQFVLVNKTQDIHVGDIVSVNSKEYGGIMKRVDKIKGDKVYVVSDNKNVYYQEIDGELYEFKGLCTWVDLSEIEGVAIAY